MNIFEMAKKYYPTFWKIDRIKKLVGAGKLTLEQYKDVTGEDYE